MVAFCAYEACDGFACFNYQPDTAVAHAAARFGLGARPGTSAEIGANPHGWVTAQIGAPADTAKYFTGLPARRAVALTLADFRSAKRRARWVRLVPPEAMALKSALRDIVMAEIEYGCKRRSTLRCRCKRDAASWSNHFTTSTKRLVSAPFGPVLRNARRCARIC